jgi:hypothetical protein
MLLLLLLLLWLLHGVGYKASETTRLPSPGVTVRKSAVQGTGETPGASPEELPPEPTEEGERSLHLVRHKDFRVRIRHPNTWGW